MAKHSLDISERPLYLVTYASPCNDQEFGQYLADVESGVDRSKPYAMVLDAREAAIPTLPQRRAQADYIRRHQEFDPPKLSGHGLCDSGQGAACCTDCNSLDGIDAGTLSRIPKYRRRA